MCTNSDRWIVIVNFLYDHTNHLANEKKKSYLFKNLYSPEIPTRTNTISKMVKPLVISHYDLSISNL